MPPDPNEAWRFLVIGYLLTVAIETPILLLGLSPRHRLSERLFAGLWLTACTYPIVVLVLPYAIWTWLGRGVYILVTETAVAAAECLLFWLVFGRREDRFGPGMWRDFSSIVLANVASFVVGEWCF